MKTFLPAHVDAKFARAGFALRLAMSAALIVGCLAGLLIRVAFTDPLASPSRR